MFLCLFIVILFEYSGSNPYIDIPCFPKHCHVYVFLWKGMDAPNPTADGSGVHMWNLSSCQENFRCQRPGVIQEVRFTRL